MNVNLKLSGLYSSLFVIRFSLIFQKKFGGGGGKQKRASALYLRLKIVKWDPLGFVKLQLVAKYEEKN